MSIKRRQTYLFKGCPRCGRKGEVFLRRDGMFDIQWEGESRSGDPEGDQDLNVSIEDLTDTLFGCGYDSAEYVMGEDVYRDISPIADSGATSVEMMRDSTPMEI